MPPTNMRTRRSGRPPGVGRGNHHHTSASAAEKFVSLASSRTPRNLARTASSTSLSSQWYGGSASFDATPITARYERQDRHCLVISGLRPEHFERIGEPTHIDEDDVDDDDDDDDFDSPISRAAKRRKTSSQSSASVSGSSQSDHVDVRDADLVDAQISNEVGQRLDTDVNGESDHYEVKPPTTRGRGRGRGRGGRGRGGRGRGGRGRGRGRGRGSRGGMLGKRLADDAFSDGEPTESSDDEDDLDIEQPGHESEGLVLATADDTAKRDIKGDTADDSGDIEHDDTRLQILIEHDDDDDDEPDEPQEPPEIEIDQGEHIEDILLDDDLPSPFQTRPPTPQEKDCVDAADFIVRTRFEPMTDPQLFIKALSRIAPSERSTENLYAITLNAQRAIKAWQDEYLLLDKRTAPHQHPPKKPATGGRVPVDSALWEDQKEADLYGYTYDAKKGPGGQNAWLQRTGSDMIGGRELRVRRARDVGEAPSDEDEGAQSATGTGADAGQGVAGAVGRRKRKAVTRYDGMPDAKRQRGIAATPEVESFRKKRGRPSAAEKAAMAGSATLAVPPRIREMREESMATTVSDDDVHMGSSFRDSTSPGPGKRRGRPPGSKNIAPRADKGIKKGPRGSRSPFPAPPEDRLSDTPAPPTNPPKSMPDPFVDETPRTAKAHVAGETTGRNASGQLSAKEQASAPSTANTTPGSKTPATGPTGAQPSPASGDGKRKQRVKSEKRSQSMTLWWASRKAAQEEKRRKEAEDQRRQMEAQQLEMQRRMEQERQLQEQQMQLQQQAPNFPALRGLPYPPPAEMSQGSSLPPPPPGMHTYDQRRAPLQLPGLPSIIQQPPPQQQQQQQPLAPANMAPGAQQPKPTEAEQREFVRNFGLQTFEMAGLNVRRWEPGVGDGSGKVSIAGTSASGGRKGSTTAAGSPTSGGDTPIDRRGGEHTPILPSPSTSSFQVSLPAPSTQGPPPQSAPPPVVSAFPGPNAVLPQSSIPQPTFYVPKPKKPSIPKIYNIQPRPPGLSAQGAASPPAATMGSGPALAPAPERPPATAGSPVMMQGNGIAIAPAPLSHPPPPPAPQGPAHSVLGPPFDPQPPSAPSSHPKVNSRGRRFLKGEGIMSPTSPTSTISPFSSNTLPSITGQGQFQSHPPPPPPQAQAGSLHDQRLHPQPSSQGQHYDPIHSVTLVRERSASGSGNRPLSSVPSSSSTPGPSAAVLAAQSPTFRAYNYQANDFADDRSRGGSRPRSRRQSRSVNRSLSADAGLQPPVMEGAPASAAATSAPAMEKRPESRGSGSRGGSVARGGTPVKF